MKILRARNAITKQFKKLFDGRLRAGVPSRCAGGGGAQGSQAQDRARGLRTIIEQVLLDTMYELPSMENVTKVWWTKRSSQPSDPYLIYRQPCAAKAAAE